LSKSFPAPPAEHQLEEPTYTQYLDDKFEVTHPESVSYATTMPLQELKTEIDGWLARNQIDCTFSSRSWQDEDNAMNEDLEWETTDPAAELQVEILVQYSGSEMVSRVYANFN
jgi:hypothetical protein